MEIAILQRRRGSTTGSIHSISPSTDPVPSAPAPSTTTASGLASNFATMGTPENKATTPTTEEKNTTTTTTTGDNVTDEKSGSPNLETDG